MATIVRTLDLIFNVDVVLALVNIGQHALLGQHQLTLTYVRPMVSENYTQCKVPAHGAVTTFQKDQDSRNYSQNSPIHPINKPSKRRLTIVKSQNRRLGDLGQMVPSGRILTSGAQKRHIESWRTWGKNAIGQLAHEIAGTAKEMARTSPIIMGLVESGALATHINAFLINLST